LGCRCCEVAGSGCGAGGDPRVFRPYFLEHWFYGVHFVDAVLGAKVVPTSQEGAGGWWTECLTSPVGTLPLPDLQRSAPWQQAQSLARAMAATQAEAVFLAPQVLASPLNIAVNLYGEEFLVALALEPEAAQRDLRVITDTIQTLTHWFLQAIPPLRYQPVCVGGRCQPRGFGQICGCTTQLLSAGQYRAFIAPLDCETLSCYPRGGGMIHLCGSHGQHIPAWREMPAVRAIQLNDRAADELELYYRGLREDQVIYVNPTSYMTVERIMAITRGHRVVIVSD